MPRVSIEDVGVATAFLAREAVRLITGETLLHSWELSHHRLAAAIDGLREHDDVA